MPGKLRKPKGLEPGVHFGRSGTVIADYQTGRWSAAPPLAPYRIPGKESPGFQEEKE